MFNHLLTVFVCAADCGSFNKAAEKLYLSAPSVMKQVNALEKQLDMKLFHRTNQGLHLTPRRSGDLPPCQIPFFLFPECHRGSPCRCQPF
ncbi:MAG: LysR family transcriptional regulator [Roseburia faecis]